MNLIIASVVSFIVFLFIDKFVINNIRKLKFSKNKMPELAKISWLALFTYVRKISFISAFTYAGLWLLFNSLNFLSWLTSSSDLVIGKTMSFFIFLNNSVNFLKSEKSLYILISLSIISLIYLIVKTRNVTNLIYNELQAKQKNGSLKKIENSPEMSKLLEKLGTVISEHDRLSQFNPEQLNNSDKQQLAYNISLLKQYIPYIYATIQDIDVRRRIFDELENKYQTPFQSQSLKNKFLTILTSKGIVNSISSLNGTIGKLSIVVLLLSFLVANGNVINNALDNYTINLASVSFEAQSKKLDDVWSNNFKEDLASEESKESDDEIIDNISRNFELRYFRVLSPEKLVNNTRYSFYAKSDILKQQIIKNYATSSDGSLKHGFKVNKITDNLNPTNKSHKNTVKFYNDLDNNIHSKSPVTEIGKQFRDELKLKAKQNPSAWKKVKANYSLFAKSFTQTANSHEILGMFINETVNSAFNFGENSYALTSEMTENISKKVSKSTLKKLSEYKIKKFSNDLLTENIETALTNISNLETTTDKFLKYQVDYIEIPIDDYSIQEVIQNKQSTIVHNEIDELSKTIANTAKDDFADAIGQDKRIFAESVSDFESHFPSENQKFIDEFNTNNYEGNNGGGGGGGGGGGNRESPKYKRTNFETKSSFSRARSYKSLRGFRRIGGVLIGKEPENTGNTNMVFTDIFWESKNQTSIEIKLKRNDGKIISAGTYEKDIINQALTYVSDNRLVTTTMINAQPIPFLKIFVHPALVNTELGCQSIGLDRLVDKYTVDNKTHNQALSAFSYQELLYKYSFYRLIAEKVNEKEKDYLNTLIIIYESEILRNWSEIYNLLEKGKIFENVTKSHIAAKPEFYNSEVVNHLKSSISNCNGNCSIFFKNFNGKSIHVDESVVNNVLNLNVEQWSGVREQSYNVDNELNFLKENRNDLTYPILFIRQIVLNNESEGEEETDENPWEFPDLESKEIIKNCVIQGIMSNEKDLNLVNRMKSFIFAQRLFRVALNGDLGFEFPIEKLLTLSIETKDFVREVETPTWNIRYSEQSIINNIRQKHNSEAAKSLQELIKAQQIYVPKNLNPCN